MKVGDMVWWHDSAARKFRNGIIVEIRPLAAETQYDQNLYFVMWGHGKVFPHKRWELRSISESR